MSFHTISFLFAFLPVCLLLYYVLPAKLRPAALILLSLVFYAWGDAKSLVVLLFSLAFNYLSGAEIGIWLQNENRAMARIALYAAVIVDVAVLCWYKYAADALPIGISFYTFSALSYIFDVWYGRAEGEKNPLPVGLYMIFFPKLVSGPIVRYADFRAQLGAVRATREDIYAGAERFLVGLFKKALLADNLGRLFTAIHGMSAMSAGTAWLGMLLYSFQLYYDFSGYSDMAIGLSRIFGYRVAENFDHPYLSANIGEFWRRWHISLGAWFREYVYIPLGGNRQGACRQFRNLLIVWVLTGLWHGSTLNFLVWGLWHGAFVILERFVIRDRLDRVPRPARVIVSDLIVFVGWVFFFSPSLGGAFAYLGQMFGAAGLGFWDAAASYYLRSGFWLLLAAVMFAGPLARRLQENLLARAPQAARTLNIVLYGALLAFSTAAMVNATYSSFLYFQF